MSKEEVRKPQFDTANLLAELRGLVEIESPTTVPEAVNRMVDHVERAYRDIGGQIRAHPRARRLWRPPLFETLK
jgi:hypothetical protein